ncbi:FAS1 domain-containing protein [Cokeromyces recurvatus]|uniref:FAS1 domain-containing protein n=1 Tax=Cokeromyces recurvatus TaxID=90255 RepID=UPI00221F4BFC|nr:FAS1 domain-containing protein [Cokeromyces recurvatus]KAI7897726.1 FAS1 domain-containing protein [Cokeromyces recurvatus]
MLIIKLFFLYSLLIMTTTSQTFLYESMSSSYLQTSQRQSLFDKLAPDPALSTFMDVLTQVDDVLQLINSTHDKTLYTIFCPINSAFQEFRLLYGHDNLDEFLRNHIVPHERLLPSELPSRHVLPTLLDHQTIQVKYHYLSHKVVLNGHAQVDMKHVVEATNGIAYKINHLLRPAK